MVLVVTSETFLEAVRENMELLDLSENEAREETINQFKAQGADVSNIIMDSSLQLVSSILNNLTKLIAKDDDDNSDNILSELVLLNNEMNKDVTVRVHAGKQGAYKLLLDCLEKVQDEKVSNVVETLSILMNGYPDLLDLNGVNYINTFLEKKKNESLTINTLKWVSVSIVKDEKNRVLFMNNNIADKFESIIRENVHNRKIIIELCQCVKRFIADDDIRVVCGNQHEHARTIATSILCLNTKLLQIYNNDEDTLYELLQMMTNLIVRNEFCIQVHEQNGVTYILDAMVHFPDSEKINRQCLLVLKGLAGSDEVKEPIVKAGAAGLIVSAMNRHKKSPGLISSACVCISALALRSPFNGKAFAEVGAPEIIVQSMSAYKNNPVIQTGACSAIRNHITRCPETKEQYLELGVEELLNNIKQSEGKLEFEAKSVLKDLGCNVHLEEQWRGTGHSLAN